jgi:hypothetical protein
MAKKGNLKGRSQKREVVGRPVRWRAYKQYFLIVCEDQKTEPAYFTHFKNLFPQNTLYLETIGTGLDPLGVVEAAIKCRKELQTLSYREIDFTWVVFDKDDADLDSKKTERFNQAFLRSKDNNISIALSNEVFEVWLLLHFLLPNYDKPIHRKKIYELIEKNIKIFEPNFIYNHGKTDIIRHVLNFGDQNKAISNSIILEKYHGEKNLLDRNPSTDVYKLVLQLNDWIQFYNYQKDTK